jgi:hypothetical protein
MAWDNSKTVPPGYRAHFEEVSNGNFIDQYINGKLHKRIPIHEYVKDMKFTKLDTIGPEIVDDFYTLNVLQETNRILAVLEPQKW